MWFKVGDTVRFNKEGTHQYVVTAIDTHKVSYKNQIKQVIKLGLFIDSKVFGPWWDADDFIPMPPATKTIILEVEVPYDAALPKVGQHIYDYPRKTIGTIKGTRTK